MSENEQTVINGEPVYEEQKTQNQTENMNYGYMDYGDNPPQYENQQTYYGQQKPPYPKKQQEEYGLISMICGIVGLIFMGLFPFSPALGIAAVILAKKSTDPKEASYKQIGNITGIISIVLSVLLILFFIGLIIIVAVAGASV